jgi:hypothetical protein
VGAPAQVVTIAKVVMLLIALVVLLGVLFGGIPPRWGIT